MSACNGDCNQGRDCDCAFNADSAWEAALLAFLLLGIFGAVAGYFIWGML